MALACKGLGGVEEGNLVASPAAPLRPSAEWKRAFFRAYLGLRPRLVYVAPLALECNRKRRRGTKKQIPKGNDRKKGKGNGKYWDSSLRSRMTRMWAGIGENTEGEPLGLALRVLVR